MGCGQSSTQTEKTSEHGTANGTAVSVGPEKENESTARQERRRSSLAVEMSKQPEDFYPPALPPKTKKNDIFNPNDYVDIDKHAVSVPTDLLYESYEVLAAHLLEFSQTDLGKLRALFTWFTSVDIRKLQNCKKLPDPGTPLDYLLKINWLMGNHAHFFCTLCRAATLPAVIITGVNKSAAYQIGKPVDADRMQAQWNAVYVDNSWRLLDVFWSSTCVVGKKSDEWELLDNDADAEAGEEEEEDTVHRVNESFFIPDPEDLIRTHKPLDDKWQLLDPAWTDAEFENHVYIRERFSELGCSMLDTSHKTCVLQAEAGEITISFGLPADHPKTYVFRYMLFKAKQPGEEPVSYAFDDFVFYQKSQAKLEYRIRFPLSGRFKFDVYGMNSKHHETFDLICTYLVDCDKPLERCEPLPDVPDIGWGPGKEAEDAGIHATTHQEGLVETSDGDVELRFSMDNTLSVMQNLKNNNIDEFLLQNRAMLWVDGQELVLKLRLTDEGEYALKLFADEDTHTGSLTNVCNYLIKCMKDTDCDPFPQLHSGTLGKTMLCDKLNVRALNSPDGLIKTSDGNVFLEFEKGEDVEIFAQLTSTKMQSSDLVQYVKPMAAAKDTTFTIHCPRAGEYGFNVFARKKGQARLYHVYTYMIVSDQQTADENQAEGSPPGEIPVERMEIIEDITHITFAGTFEGDLTAEVTKKNAKDEVMDDMVTMTSQNSVKLVIRSTGEYVMNVFSQKEMSQIEHVCIYHLYRREPTPDEQEQLDARGLPPEEVARLKKEKAFKEKCKRHHQALKAAMASQDAATLEQAIEEFEQADIPDETDQLGKAKRQLEFINITELLNTAMNRRHLKKLEQAVKMAEDADLADKLGLQLTKAKQILEQLKRLERLRHEIMSLNQRTIAEIRSYSNPPEQVHQVMIATYVVLGEKSRALKEWKQTQAMIGKTGKVGLKRRIGDYKVEDLKPEIAVFASSFIDDLDLEVIRDKSSGAAAFYVWTKGMIEECENRYEQDGGNLDALRDRYKKKRKQSVAPIKEEDESEAQTAT